MLMKNSRSLYFGILIFLALVCFEPQVLAASVNSGYKLAVPFHRQQHALSCEVATLKMALNYKGVKVSENELIKQLPWSDIMPRQPDNTWGDPNEGFVGNINGFMPNQGYGVYEQPIYNLALQYRQAKIITSGVISDLIAAIDQKNPVIVWGVVGQGRDISWKTVAGYEIKAKMGEHTRVLIGYTGTSKNPQKLILLDPIYGRLNMKMADFLKNWEALDKKAVVIY
jgi:uncharacterized protein YvpB